MAPVLLPAALPLEMKLAGFLGRSVSGLVMVRCLAQFMY